MQRRIDLIRPLAGCGLLAAVALAASLMGHPPAAAQAPKKGDAGQPARLADERFARVRRLYENEERSLLNPPPINQPGDPAHNPHFDVSKRLHSWAQRGAEALLDAGRAKPEQLAFLRAHADRMKKLAAMAREAGPMGGFFPIDTDLCELMQFEAESWLARLDADR